jgi:hypothetical protein
MKMICRCIICKVLVMNFSIGSCTDSLRTGLKLVFYGFTVDFSISVDQMGTSQGLGPDGVRTL